MRKCYYIAAVSRFFLRIIVLPFQKVNKVVCVKDKWIDNEARGEVNHSLFSWFADRDLTSTRVNSVAIRGEGAGSVRVACSKEGQIWKRIGKGESAFFVDLTRDHVTVVRNGTLSVAWRERTWYTASKSTEWQYWQKWGWGHAVLSKSFALSIKLLSFSNKLEVVVITVLTNTL